MATAASKEKPAEPQAVHEEVFKAVTKDAGQQQKKAQRAPYGIPKKLLDTIGEDVPITIKAILDSLRNEVYPSTDPIPQPEQIFKNFYKGAAGDGEAKQQTEHRVDALKQMLASKQQLLDKKRVPTTTKNN